MGNKNSGRRAQQIKPSPNQSSFGIWLTSYLSKHKLSIMDLARLTGPTDRAIRDWIDGKFFPTFTPMLPPKPWVRRNRSIVLWTAA